MKAPTIEDFEQISRAFEERWNFPNCMGSIDGKHIRIKCPTNSGSVFYNYKSFFSIVLLAVADATYKFIVVDIGAEGSASDSGVFSNSSFGKSILESTIELPPQKVIGTHSLPPVFVGDQAFPLRKNLMRPFPGNEHDLSRSKRIFNYRLSRARMSVENAFGVLAARWRIFYRPIDSKLETVKNITMACVCLHNYLVAESSDYCNSSLTDTIRGNGEIIPGQWRVSEPSFWSSHLNQQGSNNHTLLANETRIKFQEYFNSHDGQLSWQSDHLFGSSR